MRHKHTTVPRISDRLLPPRHYRVLDFREQFCTPYNIESDFHIVIATVQCYAPDLGQTSAILKRYVSNFRLTFAHQKQYVWDFRQTSLLLEHDDTKLNHTIGKKNELSEDPGISCRFKNAIILNAERRFFWLLIYRLAARNLRQTSMGRPRRRA